MVRSVHCFQDLLHHNQAAEWYLFELSFQDLTVLVQARLGQASLLRDCPTPEAPESRSGPRPLRPGGRAYLHSEDTAYHKAGSGRGDEA